MGLFFSWKDSCTFPQPEAHSGDQGPLPTTHFGNLATALVLNPDQYLLKEKPILEKPMDFVTLWYNKDSYWVQVWPSEARVPEKASYKDMAPLKLPDGAWERGEVNVARGDLPLSLLWGNCHWLNVQLFPSISPIYIDRWWLLIFSS